MKYRRKASDVEAFKWDGGQTKNPDWFDLAVKKGKIKFVRSGDKLSCRIAGIHGLAKCELGDYVVRRDEQDIYPVKNNIFLETYEEIKRGKVRNNTKG